MYTTLLKCITMFYSVTLLFRDAWMVKLFQFMTIENLTNFFFFLVLENLKIISAITVQCHFHDLYTYIYLTKMIANNPIVKALKEYKGSNTQSHLDEKH